MTIAKTTTISEVAVKIPQATRVFEKLGIDYCCGGGQSLDDACRLAGTDVNELIRAIEESPDTNSISPVDYAIFSQRELVEHIVNTHHVFTRVELKRLKALTEKVVSVHGGRHRELFSVQKTLSDITDDLTPHLLREENVLFPYIVGLESALAASLPALRPPFITVQNPVRMMRMEHDWAGELLRELRRLTANYTVPADACISYKTLYTAFEEFEKDLHQHIHLENNILFPRAIEMESRFEKQRTAS